MERNKAEINPGFNNNLYNNDVALSSTKHTQSGFLAGYTNQII